MTPKQFIAKWQANARTERAACQEHFIDLCRLLDEPTPNTDPTGATYAFEKGATKATGEDGWADVWRKERFAWEYKGKRKDLDAAYRQLLLYAGALGNPPLLVVSDISRIVVRTNWTNEVSGRHDILLADLADPAKRNLLKLAFSDPERLRPGKTREALTANAAGKFAGLAERLRRRKHDPQAVAHFVNRLVFCLFADDVGLLPHGLFDRMLGAAKKNPARFTDYAHRLFRAMAERGGEVDFTPVQWFNGGLFDDDAALPLEAADIEALEGAASLDWADIDPSIMGTLFERGLDPSKRGQLGAHYTDRKKIMSIVEPVVVRPLMGDWSATHDAIAAELAPAQAEAEEAIERAAQFAELTEEVREVRSRLGQRQQLDLFAGLGKQKRVRSLDAMRAELRAVARRLGDAQKRADKLFKSFLARLRAFRVLDPACGSGNFLYLALIALKDIEHQAMVEAEALGIPREFPQVGPEAVLGIELNGYAAELARVSVWIGHIQWARRHGLPAPADPVLRKLDTIQTRNAIINEDGSAAPWPRANAIIGNPPYLGAKLMKRRLGAAQTEAIRALYDGRLPGFTDLVCYWFENARRMIEAGESARAGLVATNSIRKNTNLPVMRRIAATTRVFEAWSEEKWTVEGAVVDVSIVCFGELAGDTLRLDGQAVAGINPDLTSGLDLTLAKPLQENKKGAFLGIQKSGPFDVPGVVARRWMAEPANPNGRVNTEVLKPYWNGDDLTGRPRDVWFIDLPIGLPKGEAALFAGPFHHLATTPDEDGKLVQQLREESGSDSDNYPWWQPWRPRPEMRSRIEKLSRYIVTAETAEHRLFVWLAYPVLPDKNLIVVPREDDLMFGLLQSRFHGAWALRKGSDLQDRPRYTHTTTFATFPFPEGMTPDRPVAAARALPAAPAIEAAAKRLDELRSGWLYPADQVRRVPEVVPGFPDRAIPKDQIAARVLARRTLTALYNDRPGWLAEVHRDLDAAVAAAYGWSTDITDDEVLARLLALNSERVASIGTG